MRFDSVRVLVAHNFYQQPGGEDVVFDAEVRLLRRFGHDVQVFTAHNDELHGRGQLPQLVDSIWNRAKARALCEAARAHRAEIVHFHNTFPLISPAAYSAAHRAGAAVVQTLHNYRLICPGSLLLRDGAICQRCVGRMFPIDAVRYRCYRKSFAATAATALVISIHRLKRTWRRDVDAYIALSEFGRGKFIEGGLPADRILVKPNFIDPDPGMGEGRGGYVLFVGRLAEEKGVRTLLDAWKLMGNGQQLRIAGDGPLRQLVERAAHADPSIKYLGRRPREEVMDLLGAARCLVFPSHWYEGQPMTVIESLACGTPVVASRLGAIAEMLQGCDPDLLCDAASPRALADTLDSFLTQNPDPADRKQARQAFLARHTAPRNHEQLIAIYQKASDRFNHRCRPDWSTGTSDSSSPAYRDESGSRSAEANRQTAEVGQR